MKNRCLGIALALAGALPASASDAPAPAVRMFGLQHAQVADTMLCFSESTIGHSMHFMYASGRPIEDVLPLAVANGPGNLDAVETERRLREMYARAPVSAAAAVEPGFKACLAERQVPLDNELAGDCFLASYFLASEMLLHRADAAKDPKAFAAPIQDEIGDKPLRKLMPRLVAAYAARPPGDPKRQAMQDLHGFLQCAAPGQPPISEG